MTCREFTDFIGDYLADELPPAVRARFADHLRRCANCRRYLAGYERAVALGKRAFDDDDMALPATVPDDLVKAILVARSRPH